jgi:aromatic-L-amino-acid decarboxylase
MNQGEDQMGNSDGRTAEELRKLLSTYSSDLEATRQQRDKELQLIQEYADGFYSDLAHARTFTPDHSASPSDEFLSLSSRADLEDILGYIKHRVDFKGLNAASGGHMGYIPGGGIFEAALGDFIAAVGNQYAGVFFASPGAVRMENSLIRWAGELIGYRAGFAGNLTSGGSMANLIAIATARKAKNIRARQIEETVVYTTRQTHHSLLKALRINGLHECVLRVIPTDGAYRMNVEELERTIEQDRTSRLRPFLVISNAGSTDVGAVDPLSEVAGIATRFDLWHHVDAAYGGFFQLTQYGKNKLKGIELADSVILDPHKGLFLPYGSGIVLVKDGDLLHQTFSQEANYMQDSRIPDAELSPADLSPELSKHFRGMRMWLPLKLHGIKPFADTLDEKLLLAGYFYRQLIALGFETGPEPDLSVVLFRSIPEDGDPNETNKRIIAEIHAHCRIFISSTTIDGVFWLRAAILSFRTHLKEVDELLDFLNEHSPGRRN